MPDKGEKSASKAATGLSQVNNCCMRSKTVVARPEAWRTR